MKIGLVDVDTVNFPNLPLMKLSAWHKAQGDQVELFHDHSLKEADKIYMSKVFSFTPDYQHKVYANEIVKGGTGYFYPDGGEPLASEIEHIMPDYSLYNISDTAYGFLTRGCPRNCGFCIVSKKEGVRSVQVAELGEFWSGQKNIVLLDPNILACKNHIELLQSLVKSNAYVDFTQGLDARLLTKKNIALIKNIKIKMLHFAWDSYNSIDVILPKLELFKNLYPNARSSVYVLCNYDTTVEQDFQRIYALKNLGYLPFVMVYERYKLPKDHIVLQIQNWANNHAGFSASSDFNQYQKYQKTQREDKAAKWAVLL